MTPSTMEIIPIPPPFFSTNSLLNKMGLQDTKVSWIFLEFLTRADADSLRRTTKTCIDQITPAQFVKIQMECRGVVSIPNIQEYKTLTKDPLVSSRIFHLNLNQHDYATDRQLVDTLKCFSNLQTLTHTGTNPFALVNDEFNESLVCDKIANLSIADSRYSNTNNKLGKFFKRFPNLQILNLNDSYFLTSADFRRVIDQNPKLTSLSIKRSDGIGGRLRLTDDDLLHVATKCPDLQILDIEYCPAITGATLRRVVDQLPKLMGLDVSLCPNITADDLIDIAKRRPFLQMLGVGGVTCNIKGQDLKAVSDILEGGLIVLKILHCIHFTSDELRHIAEKCPKLQVLNLAYSSPFSGEDLMYVANTCPALHRLHSPLCTFMFTGSNLKQDLQDQLPHYEFARRALAISLYHAG